MRTSEDSNQRYPLRVGRTLLDVTVVIVALGTGFVLLFPLLVDKRGPGRRSQCSNQLSNLAKAAILHEMSHKQFPGWLQSHGWFRGTAGDPSDPDADPSQFAPHQKLGGWAVTLLPYLDAQPAYEIWTQDRYPVVRELEYTAHAAPNLAIMQCPSDSTLSGPRGRNSYVSNNGMYHLLPHGKIATPLASDGADELAAFARSMKTANGVFNNQYAESAVPTGPSVRSSDLTDGASHTVLFSENLQVVPWHQVRVQECHSAASLTPAAGGEEAAPNTIQHDVPNPFGEPRFLQGFVWHWQDDDPAVQDLTGCPGVSTVHRINGEGVLKGVKRSASEIDMAELPIANIPHVARPASLHGGGVNMSFADGSSRFVSESIDYRVYQALMTPHGEQSDVPMPDFVLTGDEF